MNKSCLLSLFAVCACAYEVQDVDISLLAEEQSSGITFAYADEDGISLIAYYYSVNKPVPGVSPGDYNYVVTVKTDGYWIHENREVRVTYGDTIYYWVYVLNNGRGYLNCDLSWTAVEPTTTTQSTTTTAKSTTATTQAPTVITIKSTKTSATTYTKRSPGLTATPPQAGSLIFEDTFDTFDLDTWQHEITAGGGGNWEFQYYTNNRSNSYVRDGVLYIKPTLTSDKESEEFLTSGTLNLWGSTPADLCTGNNWQGCQRSGSAKNYINPIQSARLRTVNSFAFKYGKIEVEAQMPKGDWLWPAIWLMPKLNAYGQWPASGEIDLVEVRGNEDLQKSGTYVGIQQMGQALHWGPFWPLNGYPKTHVTRNLPNGGKFSDAFHKYSLNWTADSLTFYLDDELTMTVDPGANGFWEYSGFGTYGPDFDNPWATSPNKLAPFDQEFYIILNVAVGGRAYFSDILTNSPYEKPWLNTSPNAIKDFYDAKAKWYPTWNLNTNNGEDAAMKVRSVRVWAV